ncbi:MAG: cache domain-containing protein [Colwellia sp.]|nr:cache domain-containing protein [Colwellia sp.]
MINLLKRLTVATGILAVSMTTSWAGDMATPVEAKAMSEKAMAAVQEMGSAKAFMAFSDPKGGFQEKDLYVFCLDLNGVMVSHAKKPQLVGKNLIEFNKYGDFLFKDMVAVAKAPGTGWVNYKWPYPGTDEVREKASYVIANGSEFFCGVGAYK